MLRGVSGSELKRVTTGEMEFGLKYVSLMDEISTGLDSAAIFDIITTQRSAAHKLHKTVVIALLQPSPEVFALFDDVMILNEGELMYHGPCNQVEAYFETLGFKSPPGRDIADYLLDLGTKQQHDEVPHPTKQPRSPSEFAECFRLTQIYQETLKALEGPYDRKLVASVKDTMDPMPTFHQPIQASIWELQKRALMITYHFVFGQLLMVIIMGFIYCTLFYQFDPTQISVVMGVMFATVMFLSLGQGFQTPVYIAGRSVFYKQRGANFFRTGSYVLATTISQIPLALAETIIFGSIVYWICGFASEAKLFILFEVVVFLANLAMGCDSSSLLRCVPTLTLSCP
ncbi:unnamed protein product [Phytophthora lilii]|uniref:Unnamed protein product n=1 Tax=Phytophthora lilii TaxID=2077276 RepID=A0A9W6WZK9_9STRA|nr:unnamed protein product [Phytophthora lilii]